MEGPEAGAILRGQIPHVKGRSPLYERLLAGLAGSAEHQFDGGVLGRLLSTPGPADAREARLLLLAALHHAALEDPATPHAAGYPTVTGAQAARGPDEGAPAALALAYLVEHEGEVADFLRNHRLQTNEPARAAALLPGMLQAAAFGLPLRLMELGTSAGLHLRFDRYRYRYDGGPEWGPKGGPSIETRAEGRPPRSLTPPTVDVAERRGVDLHPLDLNDEADVRLLHSFVWADEPARHRMLHEALAVGRTTPAVVERGDLVAWARDEAAPVDHHTTVLFHSQVRHLLDRSETADLEDVVDAHLRAARPNAPFVFLSFEAPRGVPDDGSNWPELTVAVADGSGPPAWRTMLSADWHGRWVRWFSPTL